MAEIKAQQHPSLNLPKSDVCMEVTIINTTTDIVCPSSGFVKPVLKGQEYLNLPTFCFHLKHPSGKEIMFDLGSRKDYWNFAPAIFKTIQNIIPGLDIKKNIDEILREGGKDPKNISTLVWVSWTSSALDYCCTNAVFDSHTGTGITPVTRLFSPNPPN